MDLPDETPPRIIGRLVGVDYGTRRIGLALTDTEQRLASPADTLAGTGSPRRDADSVFRWGTKNEVAGYVVGLPLNMDGSIGSQAQLTQKFITALRALAGETTVIAWDERLSTFQADEWLASGGQKNPKGNPLRDALAASAILRAYLDSKPN